MNLCIDIGNSSTKLAVFSNGKIKKKQRVDTNNLPSHIQNLFKESSKITNTIVCATGILNPDVVSVLHEKTHVLQLNHKTNVPYSNCYKTPETLGLDRMALVSASVKRFSEQDVLIIDAGTCITYDFIDARNTYHGGAIAPGLMMRYRAMNKFTDKLPLLEPESVNELVGDTTRNAMHSGAVLGVTFEIDGMISAYKEKYPHLTVILTGGDADFLSKRIKNSIFANSNFLLEGLNHILEFNTHA